MDSLFFEFSNRSEDVHMLKVRQMKPLRPSYWFFKKKKGLKTIKTLQFQYDHFDLIFLRYSPPSKNNEQLLLPEKSLLSGPY